ncbi:MAG: hypothetical protein RMY34_08465 [Aulosira sp. DedQUE10]|nr:hypothetical protein [Aulosira sp. DedQUE10]
MIWWVGAIANLRQRTQLQSSQVGHRSSAYINLLCMLNVTIDELQRDPLKYLRQVEAGVTFLVIQADKPIAELRPISSGSKQLRPFGLCAGEFTVPDDFDAPLPEEILSAFESK